MVEISIDALLAPLDGPEPAGTDLRLDFSSGSLYQRLRDARNTARAQERSSDAAAELEPQVPDAWREVLSVARQALSTGSKDFEIAAWMTEALVRLHGLTGLAAGARTMTGLVDAYWETGYPSWDEDEWLGRTSPIGGLSGSGADGTIMQPLRRWPLFHRTDKSPVGQYLWDRAEHVAGLPEEKRKLQLDAGVPSLELYRTEARQDEAYLAEVALDLQVAIQAWAALDGALVVKLGGESPSLRRVTDLLRRMLETVTALGGVKAPPAEEIVEEVSAGASSTADTDPVVATGSASPKPSAGLTREEALAQLQRLAEFFRRTEPHSPLAYMLDEAVRRARMTFPELLAEVLPNDDARQSMLWRLGMRADGDR